MRVGVEQRCGNTEESLDAKPLNCFSSLIAISMQVFCYRSDTTLNFICLFYYYLRVYTQAATKHKSSVTGV